jgi:hypothetical protein
VPTATIPPKTNPIVDGSIAMVQGGPLPSHVGVNASKQQGNDVDARAGAIRAMELAIAAL